MDVRSQRERGRDTSPPANRWLKQKIIKRPAAAAATRVQVVYYLSRNGLLEQPHFMELTLLPGQPLRLKDVFDRLMVLRGSGMPLQYSWSSKRNYKSSYVWQDLALEDILRPAGGGGEYVLKGSELVHGCSERFQQLNVMRNKQATTLQLPATNCSHHKSKHKALNSAPRTQKEPEEYEEKTRSCTTTTSTTTPQYSRCSRGVSTEELDDNEEDKDASTNTTKVINTNSYSSTTLADEKPNQMVHTRNDNPKRLIGEPLADRARSHHRHSVLLQVIACGTYLGFGVEGQTRTAVEKRQRGDQE